MKQIDLRPHECFKKYRSINKSNIMQYIRKHGISSPFVYSIIIFHSFIDIQYIMFLPSSHMYIVSCS